MHKTVIVLWSEGPLDREEVQEMLDYAPGGVLRVTEVDGGRVYDPTRDAHWGGDGENAVLLNHLDTGEDDGPTTGDDDEQDDDDEDEPLDDEGD